MVDTLKSQNSWGEDGINKRNKIKMIKKMK